MPKTIIEEVYDYNKLNTERLVLKDIIDIYNCAYPNYDYYLKCKSNLRQSIEEQNIKNMKDSIEIGTHNFIMFSMPIVLSKEVFETIIKIRGDINA